MLTLAFLLACADPAKDKSVATVAEPPAPAAAPAPAAPPPPAADLARLPASGSVGFIGAKVTKSHEGSFSSWSGTLDMSGMDLAGVSLEVRTESVGTDSPKLVEHLKSADFFDVATHPTATFTSTSVKAGAPADSKLAGATHTVEGDLTLRGVTKRVGFPAVVTVSPDAVMAKTEFAINRKDFGIQYPGKPDDLIRDDVVLKIDLIANRAAAAASTPPAGAPPGPAGAPAVPPAGAPPAGSPTTHP